MSVRFSSGSMILASPIAVIAGWAIGWDEGVPRRDPQPAIASSCHPTNDSCLPGGTLTSVLTVKHEGNDGGNKYNVEPNDSESLEITGSWRTSITGCAEHTETASVDVRWNGSTWVLENVNLTNNVLNIAICTTTDSCSGTSGTHSWSYKLIVDLADPVSIMMVNHNLDEVRYATTSIDDGRLILMDQGPTISCNSLGATVSPTSQTWTATDSPTPSDWSTRCPFQCSTGGSTSSVTIIYD
jgi:hypothetical protein